MTEPKLCGVCGKPAGSDVAPIGEQHPHGRVLVYTWRPICAPCLIPQALESEAKRLETVAHRLRLGLPAGGVS